jgi:hypothetical protein
MPRAHVAKADGRVDAMQSVKPCGFNSLIGQEIVPVENPKNQSTLPKASERMLRGGHNWL